MVLLVNYFFSFDKPDEFNCSDLVNKQSYLVFGSDIQYVACYGVITVDKDISDPNSRYAYTLQDHKNEYEIAVLPHYNSYKLFGAKLLFYYIDPRPKDNTDWGLNFFIDGKDQIIIYYSYDDIPKYFAVDIYSGEVIIYPNYLNEIPEAERAIFMELEKKV